MYDPTFVGPSSSISRGKSSLLSDLLYMINDTMFDNLFVDEYRFDYFKPSDNKNDDMLNSNVMVYDDDDEIIPHILKFINASGFSFDVSNDWALSHRCTPRGSDLEVGQTFNSKNELVNAIK